MRRGRSGNRARVKADCSCRHELRQYRTLCRDHRHGTARRLRHKSHVRIGGNAFSPLIPKGSADILLAFEPAEAVRNLSYLKKDGTVLVNSNPVKPTTESLNDTGYDGAKMLAYLKKKCCHLMIIDAEKICAPFGSARYFNVAILGAAAGSGRLGLSSDALMQEIEARVPAKFVETNKKAFLAGIAYADSQYNNGTQL